MDILAHGLWALAGGKLAQKKTDVKLNPWIAAWWGIFPDFVAFVVFWAWLMFKNFTGPTTMGVIRGQDITAAPNFEFISNLTTTLYKLGHSFVVFAICFIIVIWMNSVMRIKRYHLRLIPWEMLAWPFHIFIDIFTHTKEYFPTQFLWPISSWSVHGYSGLWLVILNYVILAVVFWQIKKMKRRWHLFG